MRVAGEYVTQYVVLLWMGIDWYIRIRPDIGDFTFRSDFTIHFYFAKTYATHLTHDFGLIHLV